MGGDEGHAARTPTAGEHLHPVEDQADDQGDKKEQQRDIDSPKTIPMR